MRLERFNVNDDQVTGELTQPFRAILETEEPIHADHPHNEKHPRRSAQDEGLRVNRLVDLSGRLSNLDPAVRDLLIRSTTSPQSLLSRTSVPIVQKQVRLTKRAAEELVESYRAGTPVRDLCRTWNISKNTVYQHLERAGIAPSRYDNFGPDEMAKARELYESGLSLAKVGEQFGLDGGTIRRHLAEAGVHIRPRRGWPPKDRS